MKGEQDKQRKQDMREGIARLGRVFRGVIIPTGPGGRTETVTMYIAAATIMENYGDTGILTASCVTLKELREAIDRLKDDLEWVYKGMERRRKKQQAESKKEGNV